MPFTRLRLILGDQLNIQHSWFQEKDDATLYVLMEILSETNYVRHHIQKVVGFFSAMRSFSEELQSEGFNVEYFTLDSSYNLQSFSANIKFLIEKYAIKTFEYQLPDEYRLDIELKNLAFELSDTESLSRELGGCIVQVFDTEHFLSTRTDLAEMFKGKKTFIMEPFYRKMRVKHNLLMEEDGVTPLSKKWNFDEENRKKLPKGIIVPPPAHFYKNVSAITEMLEKYKIQTIGNIDNAHFDWCTTRSEALELLQHFIKIRLHSFGTYEDAMTQKDSLIFHSKLSFAMNIKLISPLEVVKTCIEYWEKHQNTISIAQIEGFVRQIIGWREYMRGIYWAKMPEFAHLNYFEHSAPLPSFYWTAETKMNCLHHAIGQSLDKAYAHHIQRLMVTGSFALLLGVNPDELDEWYLGIYMDAIEWVEITNTRGMSQFADGGIVGTKPYVGSANYIDKMSDYCSNCFYDKTKRHGEKACPFNSLYWDFYHRHASKLEKNPRIGMMYQTLKKMNPEEVALTLEQADFYKNNINTL
jgi:deoxyribodipyrimidine photolyase-related protein